GTGYQKGFTRVAGRLSRLRTQRLAFFAFTCQGPCKTQGQLARDNDIWIVAASLRNGILGSQTRLGRISLAKRDLRSDHFECRHQLLEIIRLLLDGRGYFVERLFRFLVPSEPPKNVATGRLTKDYAQLIVHALVSLQRLIILFECAWKVLLVK